jgi:phage baseplate assembly protein gpV
MKVVVGTNTIVKKITVGTPIRVGSAANGSLTGLDDVNGSVNLSDGTILQYDSNSGLFKHVSPSTITGSGLDVTNGGGLGSISYDSSNAILTYTGPSSDSIHSLFNATYDSNSLGTLSYTAGEVRLVGPTQAQIRALFSAGNDLTYNEATGEFSVNVPDTSAAFDSNFSLKTTDDIAEGSTNLYYTDSRGRAAITVNDAGGFGSLVYNSSLGQLTYTGPSETETRSVINVGDNLAYDSATGKLTFTGALGGDFDTDDARTALTVSSSGEYGSLSYNSSTGLFTHVGVSDSDIRGAISASGDLNYNQSTGIISFTERTDAQIRGLFNVGGDLGYDTATGVFSVDLGSVDVTDSAVTRALFSVVNDTGDYGSLSYDAGSGAFTFNKVTDSDIRGSISIANTGGGFGSLSYNPATGVIDHTAISAQQIRDQFSASGDLSYDSTSGQFSITTGVHYEDSDARHAIDFLHNADSIANTTEYGSVSYDKSTGLVTIFGTKDSDIRGSLTVQDSGGLGSLTYNEKQGRIVYRGADAAELFSYFSVDEDSTSLGDLYLDSATGSIRFQLDQDSIRSLISVVSDNEGGTHLSYNSANGVITYRGPADLNLRQLISVDSTANIGDGSLLYHESSGTFTYVGPVASETRKHFSGGLGIDYDSGTGTFRIDSGADARINSLIGTVRLETPLIKNFSGNITLDPFDNDAADSTGTVIVKGGMRVYDDLTVNGSLNITGDSAVFNVGALSVEDATINIGKDIDVDDPGIDGAGLIFGTDSVGGEGLTFLFDRSNNRWDLNRGLNIDGPLIATSISSPTTDGLQQQIDALPDSAQSRGLLSAGPGLTYNDSLGIFRITSSGVVAGTYGTLNKVPRFAVDSLGQIDSISEITISVVEQLDFDSTSGNLKLTTATDSFNVGITLDPFTTNNLVEGPNNLYYTRARFDSALDDSTSETRIRQYFRTDLASDSSRQQVREYFNVGASLTYDSATGKFTTNQELDSTSDVKFHNITQTGQLRGPEEFIIDPAAIGDNTGTVRILGNLTVEGVQTTINSTAITLNDKNIVIADSAADSASLDGSGITFGGDNVSNSPTFQYSHASNRFVFNRNIQADSFYGNVTGNLTGDVLGNVTGNVTGQVSDISNHNTDSLAEGSTNLYFTSSRARSSLSVVDAGGDGSFTYDSALGQFTYTGPSPTEVRSHFQVNDTGGDGSLSYDSATGKLTYVGPSEAEFYQHFKDNADSWGDVTFDSNYGTTGGYRLHERHILNRQEVFADSFVASQEYFLMYSGTTGALKKVRGDTLSSTLGGGAGGASSIFGYINL